MRVAKFGTDGVRGIANDYLTPEVVTQLARAIAAHTMPQGGCVIIGRDSRTSGPMLEAALAAAFASAGIDVYLAGIIPTPAISFLIKDERAHLGVVISASHNPPSDNGIKLFNHRGKKLGTADEARIEELSADPLAPASRIGHIRELEAAATRYAAFLTGTIDVDRVDFSGMKVVLDCAYGATAEIAPRVFRHLGATVVPLHASCEGERINEACGATHIEPLQAATLEHKADLGIAFDGDGDRVLLVARDGSIIDGDRMMGIAAKYMFEQGTLQPAAVASTVLSNSGFEYWLSQQGIRLARTDVGDRYVSHRMEEEGILIGGEPSGHIIFSEHSPTGDGILTAVKLLEIAHLQDRDLSSMAREIPLFPQCARNIHCESAQALATHPAVQEAVRNAEIQLKPAGRIVVRPSGTQPLLRVMVEVEDETLCNQTANAVEQAISKLASTLG